MYRIIIQKGIGCKKIINGSTSGACSSPSERFTVENLWRLAQRTELVPGRKIESKKL